MSLILPLITLAPKEKKVRERRRSSSPPPRRRSRAAAGGGSRRRLPREEGALACLHLLRSCLIRLPLLVLLNLRSAFRPSSYGVLEKPSRDVAKEILARFPAKTVARLRSTSKQWNALLKSGSFAKIHSDKAPKEESLVISLIDSRVCLVRIDFLAIHGNKVAPSVKVAPQFYLKDPFSSSSQVDIRNVFHCYGLLLCTTEDNRLVVWNPYSYKESDYYALCYDRKSAYKQYKILRVDRQDIPIKNEYKIYDFTSNSWRVLGVATDWFLALCRCGISLKGNTYWVATQAGRPHHFLLTFDYSTEMFQSLSIPHPFPYSISALSVGREEHLSLLGTGFDENNLIDVEEYPSGLQVWVTNLNESWNKSLAGMSFLEDEQNKVVMYLSPDNILNIVRGNKHILEEYLGGDSTCLSSSSVLLNYVPSLAQIQLGAPLGGRKRKAWSK
ncbi:hypothetical protein EUTSA_v10021953mg [Eutrema salsugineum]|uniref:F-box domain-containing protein n=1 Tax=Eutrema salsugineum TaxID=72664 RepID=V4LYF2_EUTSA|nr:hypothetical protein EUTSA_v10021953mg [Eutrema salsugineum]